MTSPGFFLFAVGTDEAVLSNTKQINIDNFIVQAYEKHILKLKPEFKKISNWEMKERYTVLYNHLRSNDVIKSEVNWKSWFAGDYAYSINENKISVSQLTSILQKDKVPDKLKCFDINIKSLSDFLRNYQYKSTDQLKIFYAGKKSRRKYRKQRKTRKI